MNNRRARPVGGIPRGSMRRPAKPDFAAAEANLKNLSERLEPIGQRLREVRSEIEDRLAATGVVPRDLAIEVFDEGDQIVAVTDLPGVAESDIAVTVEGGELTIDGFKAGRRFSGTVAFPAEVAEGWKVTVRNGLVEVRFDKRKDSE